MESLPANCHKLSRDQLNLLNRSCQCVSIGPVDKAPPANKPLSNQPNMFASTAVFVAKTDLKSMQRQIDAIESTASLPGYRKVVGQRNHLNNSSPQKRTRGLLMGYDFHVTADGARLIEVNTNAGGAFIMQAMLGNIWLKVSPCDGETLDDPATIERSLVQMFISEWQLAGRTGKPSTVAIVDSNPEEQFLYTDMLLAKAMLERNGIEAFITTPESLSLRNGHLYLKNTKIDFVYNRTTDFAFNEHAQQTLHRAMEKDCAVISPNPIHHALFADKRNPLIWRDSDQLDSFGASQTAKRTLLSLPKTEQITPSDEQSMWKRRRKLFFKPNAGYGSKATYRGDKLTRKVWAHIIQGGYIAQSLEPPPLRLVGEGKDSRLMKFDVRVFTYNGTRLLSAARIYQGQTTNFRTPGGGFAPVVYLN